MLNTPRQKEYNQKEHKMFVQICTMISILVIFSILILFVWTKYKPSLDGNQILLLFGSIVIFFLIAACVYASWEQKFKKIIFENEKIEYNCFDLNEIGYKSFINELKKDKSIYTSPEESFYMLSSVFNGTNFKIFISRTNSLIAEETNKMNLKCIEREHSLDKDLSEDKSVRINLLFIDDFNFNAKELVSLNASYTLSSKKYTSIIVDISDDKLYIPAHFGLNNMKRYKNLLGLMELLFYKFLK